MEAAAQADDGPDLFGTETMAELCARQGQLGRAIDIYRRLIAGNTTPSSAWRQRLAALERAKPATSPPPIPAAARVVPAPAPVAARAAVRMAPAVPEPYRAAMVVRQPVRSGQIVHAERSDLVVMASVNPGGQIVADGHIHVYAPLRGRAIAGAGGCPDARIFCQRLEAELVAINGVYLSAEDMPAACLGRPAQIYLQDGACVIAPLH